MKYLTLFLIGFFLILSVTGQNIDLQYGLDAFYPFDGNAQD